MHGSLRGVLLVILLISATIGVPEAYSQPEPAEAPLSALLPASRLAIPLEAPAASLTASGLASASNRLTNAGFEDGLTGWDQPSWFAQFEGIDHNQVHSGLSAFRFAG